jgi:hypothetical protein
MKYLCFRTVLFFFVLGMPPEEKEISPLTKNSASGVALYASSPHLFVIQSEAPHSGPFGEESLLAVAGFTLQSLMLI